MWSYFQVHSFSNNAVLRFSAMFNNIFRGCCMTAYLYAFANYIGPYQGPCTSSRLSLLTSSVIVNLITSFCFQCGIQWQPNTQKLLPYAFVAQGLSHIGQLTAHSVSLFCHFLLSISHFFFLTRCILQGWHLDQSMMNYITSRDPNLFKKKEDFSHQACQWWWFQHYSLWNNVSNSNTVLTILPSPASAEEFDSTQSCIHTPQSTTRWLALGRSTQIHSVSLSRLHVHLILHLS